MKKPNLEVRKEVSSIISAKVGNDGNVIMHTFTKITFVVLK